MFETERERENSQLYPIREYPTPFPRLIFSKVYHSLELLYAHLLEPKLIGAFVYTNIVACAYGHSLSSEALMITEFKLTRTQDEIKLLLLELCDPTTRICKHNRK